MMSKFTSRAEPFLRQNFHLELEVADKMVEQVVQDFIWMN